MKIIISIAIEVILFVALVVWLDHEHVGGLPTRTILAIGISLGSCVVISKIIEIWIVRKAFCKSNGSLGLSARLICLMGILLISGLLFFMASLILNMMDIMVNTSGELITMGISFACAYIGISFLIDLILRFDIGSAKQLIFGR